MTDRSCSACGREIGDEETVVFPGPQLLSDGHPGRWDGVRHAGCLTEENHQYLDLMMGKRGFRLFGKGANIRTERVEDD